MKIIPAIDLINGQCVRLTEGDYGTKKVYNENPVEVARQFESSGIKHLHLVDLDGAKDGKIINYRVLEAIATATNLSIDFGGGVRSNEDLKIAFECGANQVSGGSIAVNDSVMFEAWLNQYGGDRIILGADCRDRKIATSGWMNTTEMDVIDFVTAYETKGVTQVICTDISKDGMLAGPALELYSEILAKCNVALIASGGVSSIEDLKALKSAGCEGAIVGKALYENKISLKQIELLC